jgi:hypothetical protein
MRVMNKVKETKSMAIQTLNSRDRERPQMFIIDRNENETIPPLLAGLSLVVIHYATFRRFHIPIVCAAIRYSSVPREVLK